MYIKLTNKMVQVLRRYVRGEASQAIARGMGRPATPHERRAFIRVVARDLRECHRVSVVSEKLRSGSGGGKVRTVWLGCWGGHATYEGHIRQAMRRGEI